jgi:CheY-like chemotaxis protein
VLAKTSPDLVIMDVMMPGMDGRAAFLAMQAEPRGEVVPVVLASAAADSDGVPAGVAAFVGKRFDLEELLGLVTRLVGPPEADDHR